MNIQVISYQKKDVKSTSNIVLSSLGNPKSLDEFDINVIDLSSKSGLWCCRQDTYQIINALNDFQSVQVMIEKSVKTKIMFVMPQNIEFLYDYYGYGESPRYHKIKLLKDNIDSICKHILPRITPTGIRNINFLFENTRTTIGDKTFEADFYFPQNMGILTESNQSKKCTTVELGERVFATTLNITNTLDDLKYYLNAIFEPQSKEGQPEWLKHVVFADDKEQEDIIQTSESVIKEEQKKIDLAKEKIKQNAKYKSILYTNGKQLVEVVFEILEQLLDYDLSDFVDVNKEDFLIKKENFTFIGEIKGVTSNVKYDHVSQIEVHYRQYMDKLDEAGKTENIYQILIINPFRNKETTQREPVNEDQIALAERNGCLIIETITLLKMYENFLQGKLSTDKCIQILLEKNGLLKIEDFT